MRTTNYRLTGAVVGVTILAAASQNAFAAPVFNPENGHYYDYISTTMTWTHARSDAAGRSHLGMQGYVASVTSESEAHFINSQYISGKMAGTHTGPWLGAWQRAGNANAFDGWKWTSGEPFDYSAWAAGEPNDWKAVDENAIHFMRELGWNDRPRDMAVNGYIIEYGAPDGYTLINPAPSGEVSVDGPGGGIEQIELMDNVRFGRVSDSLDQKWSLNAGPNPTEIRYRSGTDDLVFGLMPVMDACSADLFIPMMASSGSSGGVLSSGSGPSIDLSGVVPPGQDMQLAIQLTDGNVWCSAALLNDDGADHMATWIDANDPTHYLVCFEASESTGPIVGDCNELVLELFNVVDAPLDAIPEPATLALFGLGLATTVYRRRRLK
jgi:hypothetical protein